MNKREVFAGLLIAVLLMNISFALAESIKINSLNNPIIFAGAEAAFDANVTINETLANVSYFWQFGDGANITTETNTANHIYDSEGNYTLKLNVSNENISAFKTFKMIVYQSKDSINSTIDSKLQELSNIKSEIESNFSGFRQERINAAVNFEDTETELNTIRDTYNEAVNVNTSDEDYVNIIEDLQNIDVPKSVFISETIDSSPYYPAENAINFDVLTAITGESYDKASIDKYIAALYSWNIENLGTTITYDRVSLKYSDSVRPVVNFFEININNKKQSEYYVIMKNMDDLTFEKDYSEKTEGSYFYMTGIKKISFSTTENVDFTNLPLFISPKIESLDVQLNVAFCNKNSICEKERGETWLNCSDCSRATIILAVIGGVIILGIIIYFGLRWWYKTKYEGSLFKNKNDLYNLLTYMNNADNKNLNDKDRRSKLKKAGWTGEQITYAMKKYRGKRTGLP